MDIKTRLEWIYIPVEMFTASHQFLINLEKINEIQIPRIVINNIPLIVVTEIHRFCDASELAYGTCVFIKTISSQGEITIFFQELFKF